MINSEEIQLVQHTLQTALNLGAQKARASLSKSCENLVSTLDARTDKITRCEDCSLSLSLFVDSRYGSFSTDRMEAESLEKFVAKAVDLTRMLACDPCRDLPDPSRCCRNAVTGLECGIFDPDLESTPPEERIRRALAASVTGKSAARGPGFKLISEEGEYSDSTYDLYTADTQGLECRHMETCLDYGVEVTLEDARGDKYSGYWWESSPFASRFDPSGCGEKAVQRAAASIGAGPVKGGRYNMVVDTEVASKMISPVLRALSGYEIQQNNSFMAGTLGTRALPQGLTLTDEPLIPGQTGSKLFDSEGVATAPAPIIERGVVKRYFLNTYIAAKMQMAPTSEEATRPKLHGWPREGLLRDDILQMCGDGILVTDFNGGNSNSATGDFSYGIEGFLFKGGKIVRPVSEMLITGNFLKLWQGFVAAGSDARSCMSKLIPTLAFSNVDFNG